MSRILDDLPLVVPIKMPDQENSIVYLHGFYVGFKGQYAGVSSGGITVCFN
jgi:transmembrane 9 superfamily protein 2/4